MYSLARAYAAGALLGALLAGCKTEVWHEAKSPVKVQAVEVEVEKVARAQDLLVLTCDATARLERLIPQAVVQAKDSTVAPVDARRREEWGGNTEERLSSRRGCFIEARSASGPTDVSAGAWGRDAADMARNGWAPVSPDRTSGGEGVITVEKEGVRCRIYSSTDDRFVRTTLCWAHV